MYSYASVGGVTKKRLYIDRLVNSTLTVIKDQTFTYTFNTEGKVATYAYPDGRNFTYTYDQMARPQKLEEEWTPGQWRDAAKNATYNEAGQLTSLDILGSACKTMAKTY